MVVAMSRRGAVTASIDLRRRHRPRLVALMSVADGIADWPGPYRPPWYPNQDPRHNPWMMAEPVSGLTHYQVWCQSLEPGELDRLIAEHHASQ